MNSLENEPSALMAPHLTAIGVHDHGFNNVSTYGNLWRLMEEGRIDEDRQQREFYELALKVTGAVQASRWAVTSDGSGYIYSFNGPQSLFVDTIRSCRALAIAHQLGHVLMGERDRPISLLGRMIEHATTTARYNIWYGEASRSLRHPRPHRPRVAVQYEQRGLSLPVDPTGLLAVLDLDPWSGVGHARLRRAARVARDPVG